MDETTSTAQPPELSGNGPRAGRPVWWDRPQDDRYPSLAGDREVDVAIVGAGLTGLATAAALADSGLRVLVIERDTVASGESGRSTAHATQVVDTRYTLIARDFGREDARRVASSQREAIERIAELDRAFQLDAGLRRVPAYLYSERREDLAEIEEEYRHASEAGLLAQMTREIPLPFATAGGFRVDEQLRFDPVAFATTLARRLTRRGVDIVEGTLVQQITDGEPCRVETDSGVVTARWVVVAAHVPVNTRVSLHTSIVPTRTYAIAVTGDDLDVPDALFWDNDDPYHYTRWRGAPEGLGELIVGGADHRVGDEAGAAGALPALEEYVRQRFAGTRVVARWSGQILEPTDGLPYIGRSPGDEHVFVATAYSGNGTTFAMTAGSIAADAILGRQNPYAELYRAMRMMSVESVKEFTKHNVKAAAEFVGGRVLGTGTRDLLPSQVGANEGCLIELEGGVVAVARDASGQLYVHSPVCPHMGCNVHWNSSEASWDCPCHGSRFAIDGRVLNGPATRGLSRAE